MLSGLHRLTTVQGKEIIHSINIARHYNPIPWQRTPLDCSIMLQFCSLYKIYHPEHFCSAHSAEWKKYGSLPVSSGTAFHKMGVTTENAHVWNLLILHIGRVALSEGFVLMSEAVKHKHSRRSGPAGSKALKGFVYDDQYLNQKLLKWPQNGCDMHALSSS